MITRLGDSTAVGWSLGETGPGGNPLKILKIPLDPLRDGFSTQLKAAFNLYSLDAAP
jgi:hypothetical protein